MLLVARGLLKWLAANIFTVHLPFNQSHLRLMQQQRYKQWTQEQSQIKDRIQLLLKGEVMAMQNA
jgi:hypothetical protein